MRAEYGCAGLFRNERRAEPRPCRAIPARAGDRVGGLRTALSGIHDGIVSTASLLIGVAAAGVGRSDLSVVGLACLAAGALAMAAGELVAAGSPDAPENDHRPLHAALRSGAAFAGGAGVPLLIVVVAPMAQLIAWLAAASLIVLGALAAGDASVDGAPRFRAALGGASWGAVAMASAAAIGAFLGPLV